MAMLYVLILLIVPNVLAFSFVKPAGRRFIVTGNNNIVIGNTIISNGNSGGSTGNCRDFSPECPHLQYLHHVCEYETTAMSCPNTCNLCKK